MWGSLNLCLIVNSRAVNRLKDLISRLNMSGRRLVADSRATMTGSDLSTLETHLHRYTH